MKRRRKRNPKQEVKEEDEGSWKAPILYMFLGGAAGWLITYAYYAPKITTAPLLTKTAGA